MRKRHRCIHKQRTCCVCGREYLVYPEWSRNGSPVYRGACTFCGTRDFAMDSLQRGHIEIPTHEVDPASGSERCGRCSEPLRLCECDRFPYD